MYGWLTVSFVRVRSVGLMGTDLYEMPRVQRIGGH